jgi:nitrite reductase (cytochrome c-552)
LNIARSCQTCHRIPEQELKERVETIQERNFRLRNLAMDAPVELINDIKQARTEDTDPSRLAQAGNFQRRAQFLLDFVEAENSNGFHAPQEAARLLGESIDASRKGQVSLRGSPRSAEARTPERQAAGVR